MKKLFPLLLVVAVVGGIWFYSSNRQSDATKTVASTTSSADANTTASSTGSSTTQDSMNQQGSTTGNSAQSTLEDGEQVVDIKPAAEAFASSEEALAAVLKAAKDYDDTVLEQFTRPGNNCSWCTEFYKSVKDLILSGDTPADQKSYLAEVMAISGRVENVQSLVEAVKSAKTSDEADIFSEALELSVGIEALTRIASRQLWTGDGD